MSDRLGLHGKPYIAFLGALEPRKNVAALITGWAGAVADLDEPPALVLAGGGGWSDEVDAAVAAVPPHLRLVRPGYLRYSLTCPGSSAAPWSYAYPSRGEGFGLPVLEAMACGAPVLTTHCTSLPEVGGDAVAYTEPDAGSIQAALRGLLDDPVGREALAAGRPRPVAGVHLGRVGRGAPGLLPPGRGTRRPAERRLAPAICRAADPAWQRCRGDRTHAA